MRWDELCKRVTFWALAVVAAGGVILSFAVVRDEVIRAVGMSLGLCILTGLLVWPVRWLVLQPMTRWSGILGLVVLAATFFLMLAAIWEGLFREQRLFLDAFATGVGAIILTGLPAAVLLLLRRHPVGWLAATVGLGLSGLAFLLFLTGIVLPFQFPMLRFQNPWITAALMVLGFGVPIVCCLVGETLERPWRYVGIPASIAAAVIIPLGARRLPEWLVVGNFALMMTVAVLAAFANLCYVPRLPRRYEWIRHGTLGLAALTAVCADGWVVCMLFFHMENRKCEWLIGLAVMNGIFTAVGTVAIVMLALIDWLVPQGSSRWADIKLTCPACGTEQTVPTGSSKCAKCGLTFSIRVAGHASEPIDSVDSARIGRDL